MARSTTPIVVRTAKYHGKAKGAEHGAAGSLAKGGKDIDFLEDMITSYFSMVPFTRKKELAEMILRPDAAIRRELGTASVKRGYFDLVVPMYYFVIPILLIYALIASVFSLGMAIPFMAAICIIVIAAIPLFAFVVQLVATLILFIIAKLLGGKGSFAKMMSLFGTIVGATLLLMLPIAVLGMVPLLGTVFHFVNTAVVLYMLYLLYRLNIDLHGLSVNRSILVVAVPCVLLLLLFVAILAAIFLVYFSMILMMITGSLA